MEQLCDVLELAHKKGSSTATSSRHLMLLDSRKPGKEFLKVLDFGIAKILEESADLGSVTNGFIGTPAYVSPEQAMAEPVTGGPTSTRPASCSSSSWGLAPLPEPDAARDQHVNSTRVGSRRPTRTSRGEASRRSSSAAWPKTRMIVPHPPRNSSRSSASGHPLSASGIGGTFLDPVRLGDRRRAPAGATPVPPTDPWPALRPRRRVYAPRRRSQPITEHATIERGAYHAAGAELLPDRRREGTSTFADAEMDEFSSVAVAR